MQYGIRSHSQNNENPLWWLLTPGKVQFMCVTFGQLKSLDSIPLKKTSPNSQFVNAILCSSVFHLTQLHSFWLSNVCSLFLSLSLAGRMISLTNQTQTILLLLYSIGLNLMASLPPVAGVGQPLEPKTHTHNERICVCHTTNIECKARPKLCRMRKRYV